MLAMIDQRARDSRRLHVGIVVLLATVVLTLPYRANAQNVQYDDKALDLGSRGAARIDPVTRGLSFEIPLGSYPGRAGMNIPITLFYNSKVWNVEFQGYNGGTNPPAPHATLHDCRCAVRQAFRRRLDQQHRHAYRGKRSQPPASL